MSQWPVVVRDQITPHTSPPPHSYQRTEETCSINTTNTLLLTSVLLAGAAGALSGRALPSSLQNQLLISATATTIQANPTGADGLQAEQLSFTSSMSPGGFIVSGESSSLSFTSLLDDRVNDCNRSNLLSGQTSEQVAFYLHNMSCQRHCVVPCEYEI
ncbi:unnamed protein product [Lota lota]